VGSVRLTDDRVAAYEEYGAGDGRPLVFLHGFPGSRYAGARVGDAAQRAGGRVVAPERPGIGLSSPHPGRTLLDYARDLEQVADVLRLGRFALVAESGGGPFALACASSLPERLTSVTVVGGLGPVGAAAATRGMARGEQFGYAIARRAPVLSGYALALVASWGRRFPRAFLSLCKSQFARPDREALEQPRVADVFVRDFLEAFHQGGRRVGEELELLMRPWPFAPEAIRLPVRFFHGLLDRTVPAGVARELAAAIPQARLDVSPQEGHLSLLLHRTDEIIRS
jgi:pimeloyl-ACP methyl ester carboxylesterase